MHPGCLNGLASTKKDDRQKYVEEREKEGIMTWKNFVKLAASSSAKDHPQVLAFDYMKGGVKELSKSLLNFGKKEVALDDLESPANEPAKVNAFMKKADVSPFIFCPTTRTYRFHDVFVERAARKWKERKELEVSGTFEES